LDNKNTTTILADKALISNKLKFTSGIAVFKESIELNSTNAFGSINFSSLSHGPYHMVIESKTDKWSGMFMLRSIKNL
jgi:hypothetical protein